MVCNTMYHGAFRDQLCMLNSDAAMASMKVGHRADVMWNDCSKRVINVIFSSTMVVLLSSQASLP